MGLTKCHVGLKVYVNNEAFQICQQEGITDGQSGRGAFIDIALQMSRATNVTMNQRDNIAYAFEFSLKKEAIA